MRIFSSLLFFRVSFIFFNCLFLYKFYKEFYREVYLDINHVKEEVLDWSDVSIEVPPSLNSSLSERLRLNELLARAQYKCAEKVWLGEEFERFLYCKEMGSIRNALIITGNSLGSGELENKLNASKYTLFLPEDNHLVDKLQGDVEIHYLTELADWNYWHTWDLEQGVRGRKFDFVKLDLYTYHFKIADQTGVIKKLIPLMNATQLAIIVNLGSGKNDVNGENIANWYRLFYWLFFQHGYSITAATTSGVCGRQIQNCKYRVSLTRTDKYSEREAPVFGLSSPLEEKNRLLKFLTKSSDDCNVIESTRFQTFCSKGMDENSVAVYMSYHSLHESDLPSILLKTSKFHVVSPESPSSTIKNFHQVAVGARNGRTTDGLWELQSFDTILSSITASSSPISLLLLDLEGGEWDVLPSLLNSSHLADIQQFVIKGRIFLEENENYRQFYWRLHQFRDHGFKISFTRLQSSHFQIGFLRV